MRGQQVVDHVNHDEANHKWSIMSIMMWPIKYHARQIMMPVKMWPIMSSLS